MLRFSNLYKYFRYFKTIRCYYLNLLMILKLVYRLLTLFRLGGEGSLRRASLCTKECLSNSNFFTFLAMTPYFTFNRLNLCLDPFPIIGFRHYIALYKALNLRDFCTDALKENLHIFSFS